MCKSEPVSILVFLQRMEKVQTLYWFVRVIHINLRRLTGELDDLAPPPRSVIMNRLAPSLSILSRPLRAS